MGEQEIINVLKLANNHQLKHLQWKVEYLRNDIEMLEVQKTILNRIINESQEILNNSKFLQINASWYFLTEQNNLLLSSSSKIKCSESQR
jgi:hypothetical protein